MENLLRHVDLYCERTGPEYWAEPLNALSNLAFIAAGLWFLVKFRRERRDGWTETLAWMVTAVGIGSWLFHTHANQLTIYADVIPIAIFSMRSAAISGLPGPPWSPCLPSISWQSAR